MKKRGHRQSQAELLGHLREQVDFLRSSAERFDAGYTSEAKRLATHVRVLLRDTPRSKSLLTQLGATFKWKFVDSVIVPLEHVAADGVYHGLAAIRLETTPSGGDAKFVSLYGSGETDPAPVRRTFHDWWTRMVMRDATGVQFSREALIVPVANQDGGAHVDPTLEDAYAGLSRRNTIGITFGFDGPEPRQWTDNPVPPSIRQIAQEVLWSLEEQGLADG
jgi:hypothetical protein